YESQCRSIEQLLPQAIKQAEAGPVAAKYLTPLTAGIDALLALLKGNMSDIDANAYIKAKRYLNELAESIKVLEDPNVANYITGRWSAKGQSVGELVYNMTSEGLRFGPAAAGDQEAYTALHRA